MPLLKKEEKKINNNNVKANHNDNSKGRLGKLCLTIAILCFGAKIAVFEHLNRTQPDIFTPCSTLCAGQTVSLVVLIFAMWKDIFNFEEVKKIPLITWFWMSLGTMLFTVLSPMLLYNGLTTVNVTRATIIQRFEVVHLLLLAKPLGIAKKWPSKWEIINCILIVIGIMLTLILSFEMYIGHMDYIVSSGELLIYLSTICDPLSIIINKRYLKNIPIGFFAFYRQFLGTIIYHLIAVSRGVNIFCFTTSTNQTLWLNMLWFGPCFTAIPKVCILYAMFNCEPLTLTFGTNMLFVISIAFAAIIMGENPCRVHMIGILIIVFAILSGLAREVKRAFKQKGLSQQGNLIQAVETGQVGADIEYELFTEDGRDDDDGENETSGLLKFYDAIDYSTYNSDDTTTYSDSENDFPPGADDNLHIHELRQRSGKSFPQNFHHYLYDDDNNNGNKSTTQNHVTVYSDPLVQTEFMML